jgi:hypothetical protein
MKRCLAIFCFALWAPAAEIVTPVVLLEAPAEGVESRSILIDVAVLRFLPKDNDSAALQSKAQTISDLLDVMNKSGVGDEMYRGVRFLTGWPQQIAAFNSLENRPAFRFGAGAKVTYESFGLDLKLGAAPSSEPAGLLLNWNGSYAWSTNFIPKKIWETLLFGVMTAGKAAGAGFTEADPDEQSGLRRGSGNVVGKDLISVFKKKPKKNAPPTDAKVQPLGPIEEETPHYLDAFRQERKLAGQLPLAPDQLAIIPINHEPGANLELLYLAIRYEWSLPGQ